MTCHLKSCKMGLFHYCSTPMQAAAVLINRVSFTLTKTETKTDKNGIYGIVWRCSYCTEAGTKTHTVTDVNGFQTHFIGLGLGHGLGLRQCEHTLSHLGVGTVVETYLTVMGFGNLRKCVRKSHITIFGNLQHLSKAKFGVVVVHGRRSNYHFKFPKAHWKELQSSVLTSLYISLALR